MAKIMAKKRGAVNKNDLASRLASFVADVSSSYIRAHIDWTKVDESDEPRTIALTRQVSQIYLESSAIQANPSLAKDAACFAPRDAMFQLALRDKVVYDLTSEFALRLADTENNPEEPSLIGALPNENFIVCIRPGIRSCDGNIVVGMVVNAQILTDEFSQPMIAWSEIVQKGNILDLGNGGYFTGMKERPVAVKKRFGKHPVSIADGLSSWQDRDTDRIKNIAIGMCYYLASQNAVCEPKRSAKAVRPNGRITSFTRFEVGPKKLADTTAKWVVENNRLFWI